LCGIGPSGGRERLGRVQRCVIHEDRLFVFALSLTTWTDAPSLQINWSMLSVTCPGAETRRLPCGIQVDVPKVSMDLQGGAWNIGF
jgi:hypothetical protein